METAMNYTQEDLILLGEARKTCIDRVEVLDKVKHLFFIPGVGLTTTSQVAAFYEVPAGTVRQVSLRYRDELELDGVVTKTAQWLQEAVDDKYGNNFDQLKVLHNVTPMDSFYSSPETTSSVRIEKNGRHYFVVMDDGQIMSVNAGRTVYYTKRAVLRMDMLLRASRVTQEVCTQLLNICEKVPVPVTMSDIEDENDLRKEAIAALEQGDLAKAFAKMTEAAEYSLCYKNRAKQRDAVNGVPP